MIIFRADGNPHIGLGHIMRCLSIADAGQKFDVHSLFIAASDDFKDVIKEHGHEVIILNTDYKNMFSEVNEMDKLLRMYRPSALFVDSYQVTSAYMYALWETCKSVNSRLVYIDDVLAFPYPCDILLNYNIYGPDKEDEYKSLYQKKRILCPELLLGTSYVPLRAEFQNLPDRVVKKQAQKILISTGGSDPDHIAMELAKYIVCNDSKFEQFHFHFIIGAMNDDRFEIEKLTAMNDSIILHCNVQHMQLLMSDADLAISAAGSTLYELCATQTPAVTYILADNQMPGAEKFEENEVLRCVGDIRQLKSSFTEKVLEEAVRLAGDYKERVRIVDRQRLVVDGNGAKRIIEAVCRG